LLLTTTFYTQVAWQLDAKTMKIISCDYFK